MAEPSRRYRSRQWQFSTRNFCHQRSADGPITLVLSAVDAAGMRKPARLQLTLDTSADRQARSNEPA